MTQPLSLENRVLLVTGGAGAVAGAMARVFVDGGATLVLCDRPGSRVAERAAVLNAASHEVDLGDQAATLELVEAVVAAHGAIDGVIATVGGFAMGPAAEHGLEQLDRLVNLNLRTLVSITRATLPGMIERGTGLLAGIAAAPAWSGQGPGMAAYAATKSAVATYLRSVDGELRGTDVRVLVLYPMGAIDTPANRASMPDADPESWIDPAELGWAVRFALTRSRRGRLLDLAVYPPR